MILVFWQNMLSIHQAAYIKILAESCEVYLVVPTEREDWRIKDGWAVPDFGKTKILVNPTIHEIDHLLSVEEAIHIYSGLAAYPLVHFSFKKAVKKRLRIGIISEPYNWLGIKGKLRKLKYYYLGLKYASKIDFVLAIGDKGRECFESIQFPVYKIFDWGYFTTEKNISIDEDCCNSSSGVNLIYVGRITRDKGIFNLLNICTKIEDNFDSLLVIGQGDGEKELKEVIEASEKVHYLGGVPNDKVLEAISKSDLIILPSISKDGWGAVINESLMLGIPVITSNYCGASVLLDGKTRGQVFSVQENNLEEVLLKWIKKGRLNLGEKLKIKDWAQKNISGEVAAGYFLSVMRYCYKVTSERAVAPWLKN
jgi:glycosyltransferase involved in cell wall biosynthesis